MPALPPSSAWQENLGHTLRTVFSTALQTRMQNALALVSSTWRENLARIVQTQIGLALPISAWQQNLGHTLRTVSSTALQTRTQNALAISSSAWQENLARTLQVVASPAWEDIVYRALHNLETIEETEDPELSTWWLNLPLQVRVTTIATFVWMCVIASLGTLSLEHPDKAAILGNATGLDPAILAAAAAATASSLVYKHFARPDDS